MLYRGLYVRVAQKLKVDPSYVSRVARGERHSPEVENTLRHEIEQINKKLGNTGAIRAASATRNAGKRLRDFVRREKSRVSDKWLKESLADPRLGRLKLSARQRREPIPPLFQEAVRIMRFTPKEMSAMKLKAAARHGGIRRDQGYTPEFLLEEYNIIRRCIFAVADENVGHLDPHLLVHDLGQLGEALDLQSQNALKTFLGGPSGLATN